MHALYLDKVKVAHAKPKRT